MSKLYKLVNQCLVCHAFNGQMTEIAVSANSNEVLIYSIPSAPNLQHKYELLTVLKEHTAPVTGIDWAPTSDRIVSCSADKNAYVWNKQSDRKWVPTLVVLQINRAAICVSWSPVENKFAVGSGSHSIAVCHFERENDWWVSKHIKKPMRSTVTSLDWHPNNGLIACGSTDFKVRIFSASIKSAGDERPTETLWGGKASFGDLLFEASCSGGPTSRGGWIHSVAFSFDGSQLAWTSHDSSLSVAQAQGPHTEPVIRTLRHPYLPFLCVAWISRNALLCVGHDCSPIVFVLDQSSTGISYLMSLDEKLTDNSDSMNSFSDGDFKPERPHTSFQIFKRADRLGVSTLDQDPSRASQKLTSLHQNTINGLRILRFSESNAEMVSTIGRDGCLILWDLRSVVQRMTSLHIS